MANWFYRVLNNNELSPITELQRGGDERRGRRRGGGPSGTGKCRWREEEEEE